MARKLAAGAAAREAVHQRGQGLCDRCGGRLGEVDGNWEAHHRQLRSQGGTWALSNVAALCGYCHREVHGEPERAYAEGWLVKSYDDPAEVPVPLRSSWAQGALCLLTDAGGWEVWA